MEPGADDDVTIDSSTTVNIAATTTINSLTLGNGGGSTTPTLNFSYNAITNGALIIDAGNLTVHTGATITHTAGTTAVVGTVFIDVQTGNATVTGSISANSRGFQNTSGTGQGTDDTAGGGGGAGHGGTGGRGGDQAAGGVAYGDAKAPTTLGSGGGNADATAGAGGGAIKLTVEGTTTINGSVVANGGNGGSVADNADGPGGGSGGSIWIATGVLAGSGSVTANGGNGFNTGGSSGDDGGGGGGGHIALTYTTDSSTFTVRSAYGGTGGDNGGEGGAGTIFTKADSQTNGDLLVDNNDRDTLGDTRYVGFAEIDDQSYTFDTVTLSNYGNLNISATTNISYTTLTWSNQGVLSDNGGTFALVSGGGSLSIPSTAILFGNTARSFTDITIEGTLAHWNNFTSATYRIDYTVSGNVTINGSIALNGRGYQETAGTGQGTDDTANGGGGGGHGGAGGSSEKGVAGGGTYGTATAPTTIGSGGGNADNIGGRGGGAVKLTVSGTTTVSGSVTANGTNGGSTSSNADGPGGGAAGSVWIDTDALAGSGSVTANGGAGNDPGGSSGDSGGGGGGGRIAITYTTNSSSFSALTVTGGSGPGPATDGGVGSLIFSAPPTVSSLGPTAVVDGSTVGRTPTFTATTADINGSDTVQFQIQIDDSSNFATPVVDYTSALATPGAVSFTVGQAAGSGTYTTGSEGQALAGGSYYWRMTATDSQGIAALDWTTANGGSIAFAVDATAPSGYSVAINQDPINNANQTAVSFTFAGAEVGATYNYSFDDTNGATSAVTGSGTIATATDTISGINVSSLDDDTITLSVTLTDPYDNVGSAATDTATKDATAPSGYNVTIDQDPIGSAAETAVSFTFAGAEVGSTYNYAFDDTNGSTSAITGSGTIATTTDTISGINISALDDDTIALSVTLTDTSGNVGAADVDTATKDTTPPVVTIVQPIANAVLTAMTPITGTAVDTLAITDVSIAIRNAGSLYFDGSAFTQASIFWLTATTSDAFANWSYTVGSTLADGIYTLFTRGTDAASNNGTSAGQTFTISTAVSEEEDEEDEDENEENIEKKTKRPTSLKAVYENQAVRLTWQDHAREESGYLVERKDGQGGFRVIASLPKNTEEYIDTDITAGETYTYQVRAFHGNKYTPFSQQVTLAIPGNTESLVLVDINTNTETPSPLGTPPASTPTQSISEESNVSVSEEVASAVEGVFQAIIETITAITEETAQTVTELAQELVRETIQTIAQISTEISEFVGVSTQKIARETSETLKKVTTFSTHITGNIVSLLQRDILPEVPSTLEQPVAVAVAVTGVSTFSAMLLLQVGLKELLTYLSVFATTGALPVRRESRRYGLVFDAVTGQPLSGVLITVTNQAGVSAQPTITNSSGMYMVLVPAGEYHLQAHKEGYALAGEDSKQRFFVAGRNRYRGETITFTKPSAINFDMALRHVETNPRPNRILALYHYYEKPLSLVFRTLFYFGFALSIILTALDPHWFHIIITLIYLPLLFFEYLGLSRTSWGETLIRKTKSMAPFASVKLMNTDNQMTARTIADEYGRYYLIAPAGKYQLVAEFNDMQTGTPHKATASLHLKKDFNYLSEKIYL